MHLQIPTHNTENLDIFDGECSELCERYELVYLWSRLIFILTLLVVVIDTSPLYHS